MATLTSPHWHCVRPTLRDVLLEIGQQPFAQRFYLAGGTGLALQLGHRMSEDLDFFSQEDDLNDNNRAEIIAALEKRFALAVDPGGLASLHIGVEGNFVGFMSYGYPLLAPTIELEGVHLADLMDIGLMKMDAVAGRGARKDFYDLYFIAQHIPLDKLLERGREKYPFTRDFDMMVLTAMVDFLAADTDVEIETTPPVSWNDVRNFFKKEARRIGQQWFS